MGQWVGGWVDESLVLGMDIVNGSSSSLALSCLERFMTTFQIPSGNCSVL